MNKPAMRAMRKTSQSGFTLIELIVVIVILGILAATALPKFASLGGEARIASLNAVRGALQTTTSMIHGQALLYPGQANFTNEGVVVTVVNGYPNGTVLTANAAGLTDADYTIVASAAGAGATTTVPLIPANGFVVIPKSVAGSARALKCFISYAASTATNVAPVISNPPTSPADCE
jgi:MSHA pilin protein MshA